MKIASNIVKIFYLLSQYVFFFTLKQNMWTLNNRPQSWIVFPLVKMQKAYCCSFLLSAKHCFRNLRFFILKTHFNCPWRFTYMYFCCIKVSDYPKIYVLVKSSDLVYILGKVKRRRSAFIGMFWLREFLR